MTIPSTSSFAQVPNTVNEVLRGYLAKHAQLAKGITDVKKTTRFVQKQIKENIKLTKEFKKVSDTLKK